MRAGYWLAGALVVMAIGGSFSLSLAAPQTQIGHIMTTRAFCVNVVRLPNKVCNVARACAISRMRQQRHFTSAPVSRISSSDGYHRSDSFGLGLRRASSCTRTAGERYGSSTSQLRCQVSCRAAASGGNAAGEGNDKKSRDLMEIAATKVQRWLEDVYESVDYEAALIRAGVLDPSDIGMVRLLLHVQRHVMCRSLAHALVCARIIDS